MNKIITCEECGIDYYSEAIVPRESFRHVFPDIVKLETELADKDRQLKEAREAIKNLTDSYVAAVELASENDELIEQMREALQWYKEQVSSCNRNGDVGELARDRLAKDVGKRAEAALEAAERGK